MVVDGHGNLLNMTARSNEEPGGKNRVKAASDVLFSERRMWG